MNLLALDLANDCGWCYWPAEGPILAGTWHLRGPRFEGGEMYLVRFRVLLQAMRQAFPINQVAYEDVRHHKGVDAAHIYGALLGQLAVWCGHYKIDYGGVNVSTIKRFATGKGNANKAAMVEAALKRWPEAPGMDHNEADARWLAAYVVSQQA